MKSYHKMISSIWLVSVDHFRVSKQISFPKSPQYNCYFLKCSISSRVHGIFFWSSSLKKSSQLYSNFRSTREIESQIKGWHKCATIELKWSEVWEWPYRRFCNTELCSWLLGQRASPWSTAPTRSWRRYFQSLGLEWAVGVWGVLKIGQYSWGLSLIDCDAILVISQ